ncbi:MAG: hypothetical protein GX639_18655, partial [Fibrobacter sp.]|nr:hypothetical protein [Fibrobacter sp.]
YDGNGNSSGAVPIDTGKYETGTTATVKGNTGNLVKTGYVFAGWNTAADGSGIAYADGASLIMGTKDVTLFAHWTQNATFTVTYDGNGSTAGAVPIDLGKYEKGAQVTVKSNTGNLVKTGFTFVGWATSASGTEVYKAEETFKIGTNDLILYAIWKQNTTYALTITSTNGKVTISPDATVFDSGTVVTLTPVPSTGYHFTGWSGALSGTTNPATITMNSAKSVTAIFEANPPNTFALTVLGPNGTVQKTPDQTQYDSGTVVKLTAVPDAGYQFTGWSGGITGTTNPSSVTMNEAKTVTANFVIKSFTLSVTATNGSVTKLPDADSFDSGTVVTLTAVPDAGYQFSGWDGDLTGTTNPTSIKMNAKKSVTAKFALKTYALSVTTTNGSVTRSPDADKYDSGTVVTLTAVPAAGYQFTGWGGGLTGTTNPSSVTMSAAKSVTANFALKTFALSISATNGTVTKSPNATTYDSGTVVTLTAVPNAGYQFTEWGGDLTGTTISTSVKMDKERSVAAKFSLITYTLTYDGNGNSSGSAPSSVTGIESGKSVTVSGAGSLVRDGYEFLGWNTDQYATTAQYNSSKPTITITANTKLYAIWKLLPTFTVTYNANGGGATVLFGSGIVPKDDNVYTEGKTVTVLGNTGNLKRLGYVFLGWNKVQNDKEVISSFKMGSANVVLYARWAIQDADKNEYSEVKIGEQVWMVENLKTTTLKNGTKLSDRIDGVPSYALSTHAALYNGWCYKSGVVGELAPDGWRAANGNDWSTLLNYIDGRYYKIASKEYWESTTNDYGIGYAPYNNNETGFTAYPDGYGSIYDGEYEYGGLTRAAGFWLSYGDYWGSVLYMSFEESGRSLDKVYDNTFYSVRCIREY